MIGVEELKWALLCSVFFNLACFCYCMTQIHNLGKAVYIDLTKIAEKLGL